MQLCYNQTYRLCLATSHLDRLVFILFIELFAHFLTTIILPTKRLTCIDTVHHTLGVESCDTQACLYQLKWMCRFVHLSLTFYFEFLRLDVTFCIKTIYQPVALWIRNKLAYQTRFKKRTPGFACRRLICRFTLKTVVLTTFLIVVNNFAKFCTTLPKQLMREKAMNLQYVFVSHFIKQNKRKTFYLNMYIISNILIMERTLDMCNI